MAVTVGGLPSRSICLPKPLQSKWSISPHGCGTAASCTDREYIGHFDWVEDS